MLRELPNYSKTVKYIWIVPSRDLSLTYQKQITMKTVYDRQIKLPLMKNCRVDYKRANGVTFSVLVDYINNISLYCEANVKQIKELYGNFKYRVISEMEIDNYPYSFYDLPFTKIPNVSYQYK